MLEQLLQNGCLSSKHANQGEPFDSLRSLMAMAIRVQCESNVLSKTLSLPNGAEQSEVEGRLSTYTLVNENQA